MHRLLAFSCVIGTKQQALVFGWVWTAADAAYISYLFCRNSNNYLITLCPCGFFRANEKKEKSSNAPGL